MVWKEKLSLVFSSVWGNLTCQSKLGSLLWKGSTKQTFTPFCWVWRQEQKSQIEKSPTVNPQMWNFSDLSIWVQSKFAQASLQVTCYGDSNLSVTEKPVWSRGAPSTSSWMPEKNTSILLLLLGFQTNWALGTFPGDTERMRIPKRLGVVTLVQAHPCWVQWDQHSALLYI